MLGSQPSGRNMERDCPKVHGVPVFFVVFFSKFDPGVFVCFSVATRASKCNSVMAQVKYAGLDSYASVLLFYHVHHRMDPIYTEPRPDVLSLLADTPLRLYTATNTRCVAEGTKVDYGQPMWGDTGLMVGPKEGRATRMVVRLTKKHVPGALALHPREDGGERQALDQLDLGNLVLWDAVSPNRVSAIFIAWRWEHNSVPRFAVAFVKPVFSRVP